MPVTNTIFSATAPSGLSVEPLTASLALAEATGSGNAFVYEVGSAATINLTAPNSTVGGVTTFVASNHGAGAKLLVSDSAAGQWDVSEIGAPASLPLAYGRINASVALAGTTFTDALPGILIPFTNIMYSSGVTFSGTTGIIPAKAGRYRASWLMMNGSEEFLNDGYFHVVQNGVSIGQVLYNLMEAAGVNQCAGFIDVNVAAGQAVSLHFRTNQGNPGDALTWDAGSYFQLDQLPSTETVQAGTVAPIDLVRVRAENGTAITVTTSAQPVIYGSITANVGSGYNAATGIFTAPAAGPYSIRARGYWNFPANAQAGTDFILSLRVNGVSVRQSNTENPSSIAYQPSAEVADTLTLAAGDQVSVHVVSGGTITGVVSFVCSGTWGLFTVDQLPTSSVVNPGTIVPTPLAEGVVSTIADNQSTNNTAAWVDVTGGSFTLLNVGVYDVEYSVSSNNNTAGQATLFRVVKTSDGSEVDNSYSTVGEASGAGNTGANTVPVRIATTVSNEQYKLQWRTSGGTSVLLNNGNLNGGGGRSFIRYGQRASSTVVALVETNPPSAIVETVAQTAHGFIVGDAVAHDGTAWIKARADNANTLCQGIVVDVAALNAFTVCTFGKVSVAAHGLTVGQHYWLSQATAGLITVTQPSSGIIQGALHVRDANTLFVNIGTAISI
jgi:hypothetical protein